MLVSEAPPTGIPVGHRMPPSVDTIGFTLLGPVQVLQDGIDHAPTAPKVLQLIGVLLTRPGGVVHIDAIIEELWDGRPPRSYRTTVQTYVYHLRRCIEQSLLAPDAEQLLATRARGYVLRVAPEQVDVFAFRRLCDDGRGLLATGRPADAARVLRSALDLWSGPPLANVACGPVLSAYVVDLQEQRRETRHRWIEAELACGSHRELIGELRSLTTADPFDEVLAGQLMRVLARSGRRSEAMAAYRELYRRLTGELGVAPCAQLQALHLDLLGGHDAPPDQGTTPKPVRQHREVEID